MSRPVTGSAERGPTHVPPQGQRSISPLRIAGPRVGPVARIAAAGARPGRARPTTTAGRSAPEWREGAFLPDPLTPATPHQARIALWLEFSETQPRRWQRRFRTDSRNVLCLAVRLAFSKIVLKVACPVDRHRRGVRNVGIHSAQGTT